MQVWGVGCSLDPHRYSLADLGGGTSPKCVFGVLVAVWILTGIQWQM